MSSFKKNGITRGLAKYGTLHNSDVELRREIDLPGFPTTYGLIRTSDGRAEGHGFKSIAEAEKWAVDWGHKIVKRSVR